MVRCGAVSAQSLREGKNWEKALTIFILDPQGVVDGHPLTSKGLLMDTLSVVLDDMRQTRSSCRTELSSVQLCSRATIESENLQYLLWLGQLSGTPPPKIAFVSQGTMTLPALGSPGIVKPKGGPHRKPVPPPREVDSDRK